MITPEISVNTIGWSPGQRADLLRAFVKEYDCEKDFPWKELLCSDFFQAPASTKYHGAYEGGLFDHSMNVANALCYFTSAELTDPWLRPESPLLIGVLHDICKIGKYAKNSTGDGFVWKPINDFPVYGGHGAESLIRAQQWMHLTEEESMCIRFHMGAYEKDDWEAYDLAIKRYPNVLWTHTADMAASKLLEI